MTTTPEPPAGHAPNAPRFPALQAVSWRHWLREVAVIAAGALAALAAQAWWQDRQDAQRERDYLRQLTADTRENVRRVESALAQDSATGAAQSRIVNALWGADSAVAPDSLRRVFLGSGRAFGASNFQPVTGTYAALLATGDLRLLHDERLRARVVTYAARLDSEREILRDMWQQAFGDAGRVARVLPYMRLTFTDPAAARAAAARFPFERLRTDPDVGAVIFAVQASNTNRMGHLRTVRDETRELLTLLQAQRAGGDSPPARDTASRRAR